MTWVKLDDGFFDHPKVLRAGQTAAWIYLRGLTYASRYLTDGFLPEQAALQWGSVSDIARLLAARLWNRSEGGFLIHDYGQHQRSKETVQREREHGRARIEAFRARRKEQPLLGNGVTKALQVRPRNGNGVTPPGELEVEVLIPSVPNITRRGTTRFQAPTPEEARAYFRSKGSTDTEAMKFWSHFDSVGWKRNRTPMSKWRSAAAGWIIRSEETT